MGDQVFNARHVSQRGIGVGTTPLVKLTAQELAAAIRKCCEDGGIRANARKLGEQIAKEDGVGRSIKVLKEFLHRDLKTGRWKEKHLARKEAVKQLRTANAHLSPIALLDTAAWTS